ncbi:MAG TPA: histidinol dehydrogenase [Terriglobales bacterium]|jgi:histidinol dehydrogenase|nr:histidinol dehydrogenase [Terriglobales bacterium]
MRILSGAAAGRYVRRLSQRGQKLDVLEARVRRIIRQVRRNGDRALRRYAQWWDGLSAGDPFRVSESEIQAALKASSRELRVALESTASNIRSFCEWQKPEPWEREIQGRKLGQLVRPLGSVGCYVPGGLHPLPSTLLMTVIPALVAGIENICVVSPRPAQATLAAAALLGVCEFYRVGGAQAIAALAYGTETIARVDKIVGPGNLFVTAAKRCVAFDCAVDFLAGPTEALILCDDGEPSFVASDLVAQAEHDPEAVVLLITQSRKLAGSVSRSVAALARGNTVAEQSLRKHGAVLLATSSAQAIDWTNLIAPEHVSTTREYLPHVVNAGSIFVGDYSAQAAGDYGSGPNHVLPTGGAARFRGGLSVLDFVKVITVQELSREGLETIAPAIVALAEAERLRAHAQSIQVRCGHA